MKASQNTMDSFLISLPTYAILHQDLISFMSPSPTYKIIAGGGHSGEAFTR
jgi:hypothetical protein